MRSTRSREFSYTHPKPSPLDTLDASGSTIGPDLGILAEIASFQMEYTAVAQASKKKEYYEKVRTIPHFTQYITEGPKAARVNVALASGNLSITGGMFPKRWSILTGDVWDRKFPLAGRQIIVAYP